MPLSKELLALLTPTKNRSSFFPIKSIKKQQNVFIALLVNQNENERLVEYMGLLLDHIYASVVESEGESAAKECIKAVLTGQDLWGEDVMERAADPQTVGQERVRQELNVLFGRWMSI